MLNDNGYQLNPGLMVNRRWPLESWVEVELSESGTVSIPIVSSLRNPGTWTDYSSYLNANCILNDADQSTNSTSSSKLRRRQDTIEESADEMYLDSPYDVDPDADGPSRASSSTTSNSTSFTSVSADPFGIGLTPLSSGSSIRAYQLSAPYDYVGVFYIGAFASGQDFRDAITQGLDAMNSSGVTKLIIEVSGNGGGSVANGQFMQQMLFPDKYPGFPTETRAGQLAQACAASLANGEGGTYNLFDYREYCKVCSHRTLEMRLNCVVEQHGSKEMSPTGK